MKTAVVYYSKHHGNTKKLIDAIGRSHELTLINAAEAQQADLSGYDLVGFASGIYYSRFHKSVLAFAEKNLPQGKKVFLLYTYGAEKKGYTDAICKVCGEKGADVLGEYGCFGFNTFGPFKLIGGIAKGHPTADDCGGAERFYESLLG